MFAFPPKTAFGKTIPKTRIYTQVNPTRRIRDLFAKQVAEIRWTHKLSPETLRLPGKPNVPEIQVFEIKLKTAKLDEVVLDTIDRAIPYPILHCITGDADVYYSAAFKRPSEADSTEWVVGARFSSDIRKPEEKLLQLPAALDLGQLYRAIVACLMPLPIRKGETLEDHVRRCERHRILKRQVDQLSSRIRKEKQFNRKVALNQELKPLKVEMESLC